MSFDEEEDLIPPPARAEIRADQVLCRCGTMLCIGMALVMTIFWLHASVGSVLDYYGFQSEIILSLATLFVGIGLGYAIRGEK